MATAKKAMRFESMSAAHEWLRANGYKFNWPVGRWYDANDNAAEAYTPEDVGCPLRHRTYRIRFGG